MGNKVHCDSFSINVNNVCCKQLGSIFYLFIFSGGIVGTGMPKIMNNDVNLPSFVSVHTVSFFVNGEHDSSRLPYPSASMYPQSAIEMQMMQT